MTGLEHDDQWRGVFSWAELTRRDFSQAQVRRLVDSGDLRLLRRGWYATSYADPTVVSAVSAGGVCTCVSALDLHGVWVAPFGDLVHVRGRNVAAGGSASTHHACTRYGRAPREVYPLDDVATALQYAVRCLNEEGIVAACDSVLHQGLLEFTDLQALFSSMPVRIRRLLDRCADCLDSGAESIFGFRLTTLGIAFESQVEIPGIGRVDFLIGKRLIVEVDSVAYHDKSPGQREKDRVRDETAHRLGYIPWRISYKRLMFTWDEVVDTLLAMIRRRDHLKSLAEPAELTRQAADSGIDHALGYWDDPDFAGC
ncbi:type IV toxin-antitoxin system AbiEi family antitoxin domain-containing protein [Gordonia sp. 852002-10350_SCH5691597]|uniref:type IV toxin-antitoxin system AbiEi family antitoxin domain-containing protein n=1 Tax=Gordonia sp. 852002-10350_SCH5691597 TaxID=1834085 RepID=UPI0007EB98E3|nr:type IV toxin-antitoxin system AbiEi family antitoxin domain-containing protein [Gordonia sp. 852002-10350_SCH5691597]OBA65954.1 hypothetical protein A5777_19070 [Gordonia sp. 852002-10350_SCH5691597]